MKTKIELKTAEAIQDDVNKNVVRIDSPHQKQIGVKPGDYVFIEGKRKTAAKVDRAYPGDYGLDLIRMDGVLRRNAGTDVREYVTISKAELKEAEKIIIAPVEKGIVLTSAPEFAKIIKNTQIGRAVQKGDIINTAGISAAEISKETYEEGMTRVELHEIFKKRHAILPSVPLQVFDLFPEKSGIITEKTKVIIKQELGKNEF
jgi:transitional endoplasmic reticulum ATPase